VFLRPARPAVRQEAEAVPHLGHLAGVDVGQQHRLGPRRSGQHLSEGIEDAAVTRVGLAATLAHHFRAGLDGERHPAGERFGRLAGRLALLQVGIYLVQEVLERTAAGAPLGDAIDGRLLLFGMTVQIAVAFGLAAVLAWVGRVAEVAGQALRRRHLPRPEPRSALPLPRPTGWVRQALLLAAGLGGRAPPIG